MGRFTDNGNDGNYTADIDIGTLVQVRQIRIADFIKEVVARRRWAYSLGWYWFICLGLRTTLPARRNIHPPLS